MSIDSILVKVAAENTGQPTDDLRSFYEDNKSLLDKAQTSVNNHEYDTDYLEEALLMAADKYFPRSNNL